MVEIFKNMPFVLIDCPIDLAIALCFLCFFYLKLGKFKILNKDKRRLS